ncbi:MAG TPA: hypothetical protein VFH31_18875 [Pyrinomonadaceae bacterium]|nr:hypothetical protein [Pyrinomonadaceae bacterium]
MKTIIIKKSLIILAVVGLAVGAPVQKTAKPWTEWSKKDVEKMLNDSAWGQTQSEGESSEPSQTSAITQVAAPRAANRELDREGESPEVKKVKLVKYRVRFLTAKPIREAFARMVWLSQDKPSEELANQLQGFIDRDFGDYIVVVIGVETTDQRIGEVLTKTFSTATAEALQGKIYLERKDGKRASLIDYRPPTADGMGAKFIFQRKIDGQPFLTETDNVRFVAMLNDKIKLNTRYKLSEMVYDGKLEY